ncbi:hypothetical protein SAMD00023353_13300070 [Rosellinia necatrix]|uniref:Uncharacterized protein n=1 Tax=Rosellinia necatrix TaxID=77044 RepID=A0A1S8ABE7_ROSNE|nr:hypothetical protein SAMD00023353_13300070 [Rosellinia necatrix]
MSVPGQVVLIYVGGAELEGRHEFSQAKLPTTVLQRAPVVGFKYASTENTRAIGCNLRLTPTLENNGPQIPKLLLRRKKAKVPEAHTPIDS